jgi:hypothetical protein
MGNLVMLFPCDYLGNHMGNLVMLFPCDYLGNHVVDKFRKFFY